MCSASSAAGSVASATTRLPRAQDVDLGALLVGREVGLQVEVGDALLVGGDPGARGGGRLAREVLSGGLPVVSSKRVNMILLPVYCAMPRSRPTRVELSAT